MLQRWLAVDPAIHGYEQVSKAYDARGTSMPPGEWLSWMTQRAIGNSASTLQHLAAESALPLVVMATLAARFQQKRA